MISILGKQNVDCMTGKRNTSKRWRVTAILLPLLIIGPKQATGLKGHFELIESSSVIIQKSDFKLEKETHWLFEVKYYDYITFFSLRTMKHEQLCKLPMFLQLNSSQFITSLCQRSREKIKGNLKKNNVLLSASSIELHIFLTCRRLLFTCCQGWN